MRIIIDIGHPAHVHYFRNFIKIMEKKGHVFCIIARNKECTFDLLRNYQIEFYSRGRGADSLVGKLFYMFIADILLFRRAIIFKPDLFLSFTTPYPGHVAKLMQKPHIGFSDTEHAKLGRLVSLPFTTNILTPKYYLSDLGPKQIRFSGFMELCSLHPNYFKPTENVVELLGLQQSQKYAIVRFVSWNASHDVGHHGLNTQTKISIVKLISGQMKVFISAEKKLPDELKKYQINIPAERMHDILNYASLFVGEGATMTSECAMLGTPAIYVNSLDAGTLQDQAKIGLIFSFRNSIGVIDKVRELLKTTSLKEDFRHRRNQLISENIDVTAFMVWFVENYPKSVKIIKEDPDYQLEFK